MYKGFNIIIDDMINKDVNTIDNEIEKYFSKYKDDDIYNEKYIDKLYYDSVVKQDKNTIFNFRRIRTNNNVGSSVCRCRSYPNCYTKFITYITN